MHRNERICVSGRGVGRWIVAVVLAAGLQSAFASSVNLVLGDPSPSQPDVGEELVIQGSALFDAEGEDQTQLTLPDGRVEYCWIVDLDGQGVVTGIYASGEQFGNPSGWIEHATVDTASYLQADGDQTCEVTVYARVVAPGYEGTIHYDVAAVVVPVAPEGEVRARIAGFECRYPDQDFEPTVGPLTVVGNAEPVIDIKALKEEGQWTDGYPQWTGDCGFSATGEVVTYTFSEPGRTEVLTCFDGAGSSRKIRVMSALGGDGPTIVAPVSCMLVGGECLHLSCGDVWDGVTSVWTWEPGGGDTPGAMEFYGWGDEGHGGAVDAHGLARGPVIVPATIEWPLPVPDPPPEDDIDLTVVELHSMTVVCYSTSGGGGLFPTDAATNPPDTFCIGFLGNPAVDYAFADIDAAFTPCNAATEEFMMWRVVAWGGSEQGWEVVAEGDFASAVPWTSVCPTDENPNAEYRVDVGGDSNGNFSLDHDQNRCEVVKSIFINPREVTVTVSVDRMAAGVGKDVTFTATTDPAGYEAMVAWTGGGTPATGVGGQFVTSWDQPGEKTVTGRCRNSTDTEDVTIIKLDIDPLLIWWFNGESPPNYPLHATITAAGATEGAFDWRVVDGKSKVDLCNGGVSSDLIEATDDNTVTVHSTDASAPDVEVTPDVWITLTYNGDEVGGVLTAVLTPHRLEYVDTVHSPFAGGYKSKVIYKIKDQFDRVLPHEVGFNEDIDGNGVYSDKPTVSAAAISVWPSENWGWGEEGGVLHDPSAAYDAICRFEPARTPSVESPHEPVQYDPIDHSLLGGWYVGSVDVGKGVQVSATVWAIYRDHAEHE